jgi:hypothetical protein
MRSTPSKPTVFRVQLFCQGECVREELVRFESDEPTQIVIWKSSAFQKSHQICERNKQPRTVVYYKTSAAELSNIIIVSEAKDDSAIR